MKNRLSKLCLTGAVCCALAQNAMAIENEKITLDGYIETGIGYDSNPFLTPNKPYNDFTNTGGGALVIPDKKSGLFIPIYFKADYEYRLKQRTRLIADMKVSGRYFADKSLENANEYKADLEFGVRYRLNKYVKELRNIDIKLLVGDTYQVYVDHDNGTPKTTVGGDQSNRYQYTKVGISLEYLYKYKKLDYLFRVIYEDRDYEEPATWSSLDHKYTRVKVQGGYDILKSIHAGASYEFRLRDYKERKSYEIDPDGTINLRKPGVNYTYNDFKIFGVYKITKKLKTGL